MKRPVERSNTPAAMQDVVRELAKHWMKPLPSKPTTTNGRRASSRRRPVPR